MTTKFNDLKKPWYLLIAALILGGYFILTNLLLIVGYKLIPDMINLQPAQAFTYLVIFEAVSSPILLALVYILYRKLQKMEPEQNKTPLGVGGFLQCLICGLGISGLVFLMSKAVPVMSQRPAKGLELVEMVMTSVLFAPLIEEILFRGILYNLIRRFKGGWFAILVSAAVFGVYHMDPVQAAYTTVMGIIFAYMYHKTKNLWYPILIHAVNNAFVCLISVKMPEMTKNILQWFTVVMIVPMAILLYRSLTERKKQEA